jgi:hypothetical protein
MPASEEQLFRRWGHSFEEDHDDVRVYRPAEFDFPRARGRDGIEFRPDGSYIDWVVGPGDAREPQGGRWQLEGDGRIRVTTAAATWSSTPPPCRSPPTPSPPAGGSSRCRRTP